MATIRTDGLSGTIENTGGISDTDTTLESSDLADLPEVTGGDIARLTFVQLNGIHVSSYEIVHVTAHSVSATTATISRGQEGSSQQAWGEGVDWLHAITVADIEDLVSSVDTVSTNLSSHESDTSNPHSVTSDQVNAPSQTEFDNHTGDTTNPHSVTSDQVSAPSQSEFDDHSARHESGGGDEVALDASQTTSGTFADARISESSVTQHSPSQSDFDNHSARHENGGGDEISVAGLSGDLSDPQDPKTHASTHASGSSDEITSSDIGAAPTPHDLAASHHNSDTLANLNSKVSDATLISEASANATYATKNELDNATTMTVGTLGGSGSVAVDMDADDYYTQTLSGDPTYSTANRVEGSSVLVRIDPGGSARSPSFPAGWTWLSEEPTEFASGVTHLLSLLVVGGTAESDVLASHVEEAA